MIDLYKPIENKNLSDFIEKNAPKNKPKFKGSVSCHNYANCKIVIKKI